MSQSWTPHDYQLEAVRFMLSNANAGLLLDPGLGKTACVLAMLLVLKNKGLLRRALIVAPQRVATQVWPAERNKWHDFWGLSMTVLHGTVAEKQRTLAALKCNACDIVTCTPDGLEWLRNNGGIGQLGADVLIVDESGYFRNARTLRFKNLRGSLPLFKRRVILNATPAPRGYEDLWAQIFILDLGGALGQYITHYRMKYFDDIGGRTYSEWVVRPSSIPLIDEAVRPFVLRGDAVDYLGMPDIVVNNLVVDLPPKVMDQYASMEKDFLLLVQGEEILSPNAAVLGGKLRQIANGFLYTMAQDGGFVTLHGEKIDAVSDLLHGLQGQSALIVYEFIADRDRLLALLPSAAHMDSTTSTAEAGRLIAAFNDGTLQHLIVHPASAGHGLNLQEKANHIVWLGPTWNLEHYIQTNARVWRQGNTHQRVYIHTILARGTLDEKVAGVLGKKDKVQRNLLAALKVQPVVLEPA